jgi:hypothetical protein
MGAGGWRPDVKSTRRDRGLTWLRKAFAFFKYREASAPDSDTGTSKYHFRINLRSDT